MKRNKNYLWGSLFIILAILIVLSELHIIALNWTIVLSLFMVAIAVKRLFKRDYFISFFLIGLTAYLNQGLLGIELSFWVMFLITLLLSIGLHLIFGDKKQKYFKEYYKRNTHFSSVDQETYHEDEVNYEAVFSHAIKYIYADNLKRVNAQVVFGGMKLYFEQANILQDATIDVECVFSHLTLYVPAQYEVVPQMTNVFSSVIFQNTPNTEAIASITLSGELVFSKITIIYI